MKTFLFLILLINCSFANTDLEELQRRIKLYGLDNPSASELVGEKKDIDVEGLKKVIKEKIHHDIFNNYIPKLESSLGKCAGANCVDVTEGIYKLNLPVKTVCLPFTSCGFYDCMEEKFQCDKEGVHYFTKLARPTCEAYMKNIDQGRFSKKGMEWIYSVMVCLQKGLVDECELGENCHKKTAKESCNYITEFTLSFHPGCYIESGPGVCKLPIKDKINIWKTVGPFLTDRERVEAYKVVYHCIKTGF